jgi:hypothetical protein
MATKPDVSDASAGQILVPNGVAEAPPPPAPKPSTPKPTVPTPPKPIPTRTQPESPPPPRLGPLLSPDQIREYSKALDESLGRVRTALAALGRKNLTPDQAQILSQIQVFQKQAEEARAEDLGKAVNLALRADLLAKDLQARVP